MTSDLSSRALARYGLRRGAYDGANRRRFVLFADNRDGTESRSEYDTKAARDNAARIELDWRRHLATLPLNGRTLRPR